MNRIDAFFDRPPKGGDGVMLLGKQTLGQRLIEHLQKKRKRENSARIKQFAIANGFTSAEDLHGAIVKRFGAAAESLTTIKRMYSGILPAKDMTSIVQVAVVFGVSVEALRGEKEELQPIVPEPTSQLIDRTTVGLFEPAQKAAEAVLTNRHELVRNASDKLMKSELSSLHAFLTFYLHDKLNQATDAGKGGA